MPFTTFKPLAPHVAATYRRDHYYLKKNGSFRITVDRDIKYYSFISLEKAVQRDSENIIRVEPKFPESFMNSPLHRKILRELATFNAVYPPSKRHTVYNAEYKYLKNRYKQWVSNSDTEIESKLSLSLSQQSVFTKIKNDFRKNLIKQFGLIKNHEDSWEYTNFQRYVITEDKGYIRLRQDLKHVTYKSDQVIMKDPFGLGCILKRREVDRKTPKTLLDRPFILKRRTRKTFIVKNKVNKNTYIILIDRTSVGKDYLCQIEIEHISRKPSLSQEQLIVRDIAYMTNYIIKKYPFLKPTTLTKHEWANKIQSDRLTSINS